MLQDASREGALAIVSLMRSSARVLLVALFFAGCGPERPGSIGAHLSRDNETGALYVRDLFPGLAGERAGLQPGDEIIMIDGFYVREIEPARIREMLRGQVGTAVRLTVVRGGLVLRLRIARSELRDVQDEQPKPRMEKISG